MTNQSPTTIEKINQLFRELVSALEARARVKQDYEIAVSVAKRRFAQRSAVLDEQLNATKKQLVRVLNDNRSSLVSAGSKSFTTALASFSWRKVPRSFKITDKDAALKKARRLRIARQVCSIKIVYTPRADKLERYLQKHPEHRGDFSDCSSEEPGHESLSTKPNEAYLTHHDSARISDKSIPLTS